MKPDDTLIAYWLDELDDAAAAEVEAHLFECDDCGARLRDWVAFGAAVRREFLAGDVPSPVSADFVRQLKEDGLRVREYALAVGETNPLHLSLELVRRAAQVGDVPQH